MSSQRPWGQGKIIVSRGIGHHKLGKDNLWATIRSKLVELLDQRNIQHSFVDLVRFSWVEENKNDKENEDDEDDEDIEDIDMKDAPYGTVVTTPVTIWVGVLPDTLTGEVAFHSSNDILDLLEKHGISDVDVAHRCHRSSHCCTWPAYRWLEHSSTRGKWASISEWIKIFTPSRPATSCSLGTKAIIHTPTSPGLRRSSSWAPELLPTSMHASSTICILNNTTGILERRVTLLTARSEGSGANAEQAARELVESQRDLSMTRTAIKELEKLALREDEEAVDEADQVIGHVVWAPPLPSLQLYEGMFASSSLTRRVLRASPDASAFTLNRRLNSRGVGTSSSRFLLRIALGTRTFDTMSERATVRTTGHAYPAEEIWAMETFYGGKTCVISHNQATVHWAHMLNASMWTSNERLQWMLERHLRENKHPRHATEVRENLIPLTPNHHSEVDCTPPIATPFLHEDLLARTLAFELDLKQWRLAEIEAGRGDPGRPAYHDVFPMTFTEHRWHSRGPVFLRELMMYTERDCPGIRPLSNNPFPTICTLLSIPFSLLHTFPRLSAIVPRSQFQHELIAMGAEIIFLWSWDPSHAEVGQSTVQTIHHNSHRTPQPIPIRDRNITFDAMRPHLAFGPATGTHDVDHCAGSIPDRTTFELAPGKVLINTTPRHTWANGARLQLSDGDEVQLDMSSKDADLIQENITTYFEGFTKTISVLSSGSHEWQDPEEKTHDQCWSPSEIIEWSNTIIGNNEETLTKALPLVSTPFEKGIMGGMSTNDFLMTKGLIDPGLYVQYIYLELFS